MEHPYFDSLRPAVVVQHVKSRKQSPIFEKHRALSSTHRGHTKYSAKENCNPHTVYGKFRNNAEYSSMIRSTSKGRKNLDEAKFHAKQFKASLTNSTNHLSSTMQSFNFDGKKKSIGKTKKDPYKNSTYNQPYNTKNFAINTSNNFHRASRRTTKDSYDDQSLRNSSLKRDNSKTRNNNNIKMFQINEESEYKSSPVKHIQTNSTTAYTTTANITITKNPNPKGGTKKNAKYQYDEDNVVFDEEIMASGGLHLPYINHGRLPEPYLPGSSVVGQQ